MCLFIIIAKDAPVRQVCLFPLVFAWVSSLDKYPINSSVPLCGSRHTGLLFGHILSHTFSYTVCSCQPAHTQGSHTDSHTQNCASLSLTHTHNSHTHTANKLHVIYCIIWSSFVPHRACLGTYFAGLCSAYLQADLFTCRKILHSPSLFNIHLNSSCQCLLFVK